MPITRCPSCNDRVEIEDDWYGRRLSCPSCDQTFTPQRPRGDGDRGDGDRDDDRRPRRRHDDAPPKKGSAVAWVLIPLAGLFVLVCGGCVAVVVWWGSAKQAFNDPWTDTAVGTPPVVTASFPQPSRPKYPTVPGSTAGEMAGYDNTTDGNNALDAITAVGFVDFPPGTPDPLAGQFAGIRQAVEDEFTVAPVVAADIASDRRTTVSGYPAREVVYSKDDGSYTLRLIHLNDRSATAPVRVVVVFGGGMHMQDADKQKFLNSVRIAGKK